jgi:hypothetical protein
MRALVLDPNEGSIQIINIGSGFQAIRDAISSEQRTCNMIAALPVPIEGHVVYIDDEGLLQSEVGKGTLFKDYRQPIAGRIVILGSNDEGEDLDASITLPELAQHIMGIVSEEYMNRIDTEVTITRL